MPETRSVAIVGAGIMGAGLAQCAAMAGRVVNVSDVHESAFERASVSIHDSLERFVKAGQLTSDSARIVRGRITFASDLSRVVESADTLIEAVPEILSLKQEVLAECARNAPKDCLFATNTSQLSITAIAAAAGPASSRVIGMHFFNPPVLMRLVE